MVKVVSFVVAEEGAIAGQEDGPPAEELPRQFQATERSPRPGVEQAPPVAGRRDRREIRYLRLSRQGNFFLFLVFFFLLYLAIQGKLFFSGCVGIVFFFFFSFLVGRAGFFCRS